MWIADRHIKPTKELATWEQVQSAVLHVAEGADPSLGLTDDKGAHFFVGMKDAQAFVLYEPSPRSPTVSASLDPTFEPKGDADYVEFMVGDTMTPIPKDRCIPLHTLLRILEEYWKEEHLSRSVSWVRD
jgi:hypothetical protein